MTISEKEASAETVFDKKSGLWYRPELGELFVIGEQTQYKSLDFDNKTVMDVGAHIGCFADVAIKYGAKHVWCYEPTRESFELLGKIYPQECSGHNYTTLHSQETKRILLIFICLKSIQHATLTCPSEEEKRSQWML